MKIKTIILVLMSCSFGCVGINASPYNEEDQCWEESIEISSKLSILPGGCDSEVVTTQKDGKYWLFTSGCIPDDYVRVSQEEQLSLATIPCEE